MDGISSLSAIDQKMAEMRIKNLELLKRHQEIEEDRQLAQQSAATTTITTTESTKDTTMRSGAKNRSRNATTQENQHERIHRPAARRKFESDRNDTQPQRAQRVDYNRLKRECAPETNKNNISPELLEYTYPFHHRSENNYDADEPAHAKKLVIVNNQANRVGSGRFQRTQEQGQRRREERMRRSGTHNNGHPGGPAEFHLDVPQMSMWQNGSIQPPIHLQLLPTNINGHHTGIDPLMSSGGDQLDESAYLHNFAYPPPTQSPPFNGNGAIYFAHPQIPDDPTLSSQPTQGHFHQYHPTRTFENSNRHQYQHPSHFQPLPVFQSPPQSAQSHFSSTQMSTPSPSSDQQRQQESVADLPPRFRRSVRADQENRYSQQRPMSGDFDRFHNSSSRFNNENRFQPRPQSFYDFSSNQQPTNNNNFYRSSNSNNRYPRNNNTLPLSAYMNTDESSYQNDNNNYWNTSHQRRRTNQPRTYQQDKHQFPLSSYDPRQYGFSSNYQRRNDYSNRRNSNHFRHHDANDIDLIEEWWEDDNPELIGTNQSTMTNDSQMNLTTTTVDDSGNSSLSTSMHLKESILDEEENNISTNDVISPPSDLSTADSNIIESLDQLQQQLKLEEDVEKQLASENDNLENELLFLTKETTTYDSAHFLQWAKDTFREELAGRLTAQQIKQHDAVATDDDDDDEEDNVEDIILKADVDLEDFSIDPISDEEADGQVEKVGKLEDDLQEKLQIEEDQKRTVAVE